MEDGIAKPQSSSEDSVHDFAFATIYPFALRAAVLLGVPKILESAGPGAALTAEEICSHLPNSELTSSDNLDKLLEVLSCYGVFTRTNKGGRSSGPPATRCYSSTASSRVLAREVVSDNMLFYTSPELIPMWTRIHEAVVFPEEGIFERLYGKGLYQYLQEDAPELAEFHVKLMSKHSDVHGKVLLEHYDGELRALGSGTVVDVGGSQGALAAVVASRYPDLKCVVNFDLPEVVSRAPAIRGVEHVGGSFLDSVPRGDLLLMKYVLLNWDNESVLKMLRNCYTALPPQGKLIIMDRVKLETLPEDDIKTRLRIAVQDLLNGVAFKGGQCRSVEQLRSIAKAAGFTSLEIVMSVDTMCLMEACKSST